MRKSISDVTIIKILNKVANVSKIFAKDCILHLHFFNPHRTGMFYNRRAGLLAVYDIYLQKQSKWRQTYWGTIAPSPTAPRSLFTCLL